jgi:hypothetical protein
VDRARQEYRLALQDLKKANELLGDLGDDNRDGSLSLRRARMRFSTAKDDYRDAIDAMMARMREISRRGGSNPTQS